MSYVKDPVPSEPHLSITKVMANKLSPLNKHRFFSNDREKMQLKKLATKKIVDKTRW